jgi:hypothetical protein
MLLSVDVPFVFVVVSVFVPLFGSEGLSLHDATASPANITRSARERAFLLPLMIYPVSE